MKRVNGVNRERKRGVQIIPIVILFIAVVFAAVFFIIPDTFDTFNSSITGGAVGEGATHEFTQTLSISASDNGASDNSTSGNTSTSTSTTAPFVVSQQESKYFLKSLALSGEWTPDGTMTADGRFTVQVATPQGTFTVVEGNTVGGTNEALPMSFIDSCIGSCSLPSGLREQSYPLAITVRGGTLTLTGARYVVADALQLLDVRVRVADTVGDAVISRVVALQDGDEVASTISGSTLQLRDGTYDLVITPIDTVNVKSIVLTGVPLDAQVADALKLIDIVQFTNAANAANDETAAADTFSADTFSIRPLVWFENGSAEIGYENETHTVFFGPDGGTFDIASGGSVQSSAQEEEGGGRLGVGDVVRADTNEEVAKKTEDDESFDVVFSRVSKTDAELIAEFSHNATTAQRVWIDETGGSVAYSLSTTVAEPGETVILAVPLVNGEVPRFDLHVGEQSEVFTFGFSVQTAVSACGAISSSGNYELTANVTSTGSCINITASNVVFNCQRNNITFGTDASGVYYGISAASLTNITVRDCLVSTGAGQSTSVFFSNVTNATIINNTISTRATDTYGIRIESGNSTTITKNIILAESAFEDMTVTGVEVHWGFNATLSYNTIDAKADSGSARSLHLNADVNSTIMYNNITVNTTLEGQANTVVLATGNGTVLLENKLSAINTPTRASGIVVESSGGGAGASLINNTIIINASNGIALYLSGAVNATLNNNTITASGEGLLVDGTTLATFSSHNITTNNRINGLSAYYAGGAGDSPACPNSQTLTNPNYSHVGLVGCTNVTISAYNTQDGAIDGILLAGTTNSVVQHSRMNRSSSGIRMFFGVNNSIINNTMPANLTQVLSSLRIVDIYASNNTIVRNNTIGGQPSSGHGVYVEAQSSNNTVSNNTLDVTGGGIDISASSANTITNNTITSTGTGLGVAGASSNNTITANIITTNGSSADGMSSGVGNTTFTANTITTYGSSSYGVRFTSGSGSIVSLSSITTTGSSSGGVRIVTPYYQVFLNNITTTGTSSDGVEISGLAGGSYPNAIYNNTITTSGSTSRGVHLKAFSRGNNITSNRITTTAPSGQGVYVTAGSSENNITYNTIVTNGTSAHGVLIDSDSGNNTFFSNNFTVRSSSASAISLGASSTSQALSNSFTSSVITVNVSWIGVINASTNNSITNTTFNATNGSILFPGTIILSAPASVNKTYLNGSFNYTYLNSTNLTFLNTSAQITLKGITASAPQPIVGINDNGTFAACASSRCTVVTRDTDNDIFIFNVSGFTTYSSRNNTAPALTPIPNQSWVQNTVTSINLSAYFSDVDGDDLNYTSTVPSFITVSINDDTSIATLAPSGVITGTTTVVFTASDSFTTTDSNTVTLTVTLSGSSGSGGSSPSGGTSNAPSEPAFPQPKLPLQAEEAVPLPEQAAPEASAVEGEPEQPSVPEDQQPGVAGSLEDIAGRVAPSFVDRMGDMVSNVVTHYVAPALPVVAAVTIGGLLIIGIVGSVAAGGAAGATGIGGGAAGAIGGGAASLGASAKMNIARAVRRAVRAVMFKRSPASLHPVKGLPKGVSLTVADKHISMVERQVHSIDDELEQINKRLKK